MANGADVFNLDGLGPARKDGARFQEPLRRVDKASGVGAENDDGRLDIEQIAEEYIDEILSDPAGTAKAVEEA